jgi:hypothetical protein
MNEDRIAEDPIELLKDFYKQKKVIESKENLLTEIVNEQIKENKVKNKEELEKKEQIIQENVINLYFNKFNEKDFEEDFEDKYQKLLKFCNITRKVYRNVRQGYYNDILKKLDKNIDEDKDLINYFKSQLFENDSRNKLIEVLNRYEPNYKTEELLEKVNFVNINEINKNMIITYNIDGNDNKTVKLLEYTFLKCIRSIIVFDICKSIKDIYDRLQELSGIPHSNNKKPYTIFTYWDEITNKVKNNKLSIDSYFKLKYFEKCNEIFNNTTNVIELENNRKIVYNLKELLRLCHEFRKYYSEFDCLSEKIVNKPDPKRGHDKFINTIEDFEAKMEQLLLEIDEKIENFEELDKYDNIFKCPTDIQILSRNFTIAELKKIAKACDILDEIIQEIIDKPIAITEKKQEIKKLIIEHIETILEQLEYFEEDKEYGNDPSLTLQKLLTDEDFDIEKLESGYKEPIKKFIQENNIQNNLLFAQILWNFVMTNEHIKDNNNDPNKKPFTLQQVFKKLDEYITMNESAFLKKNKLNIEKFIELLDEIDQNHMASYLQNYVEIKKLLNNRDCLNKEIVSIDKIQKINKNYNVINEIKQLRKPFCNIIQNISKYFIILNNQEQQEREQEKLRQEQQEREQEKLRQEQQEREQEKLRQEQQARLRQEQQARLRQEQQARERERLRQEQRNKNRCDKIPWATKEDCNKRGNPSVDDVKKIARECGIEQVYKKNKAQLCDELFE